MSYLHHFKEERFPVNLSVINIMLRVSLYPPFGYLECADKVLSFNFYTYAINELKPYHLYI